MSEPIDARPMRAGDGKGVVALWQEFLPDTEDWGAWLPEVLEDLLEKRMLHGGVVFAEGANPRCVAAGLSCFLPETIANEYVARPRPYLNCALLTRYRDGDASVFLNLHEQASRNAAGGLEMFVLDYVQENFDFEDLWAHQMLNAVVPVYVAVHAGFNIRRSMHETEIAVGHVQESGGNPKLFDVTPQHPFSLSSEGRGPRAVYGVSRDNLTPDKATGIAKALLYCQKPKLRLVLQEQEVVLGALEGMTDVEIAKRMGVSRDRVRQVWQNIYAHLEEVLPDVFGFVQAPTEGVKRGGEKRRVTVAYLQNRPEELRPYTLRR
ncbi:MAG: helix-turn-helix transcriptional regulator [Sulfitobacter sp.]